MKYIVKLAAAALLLATASKPLVAAELNFASFTPPPHTVSASLMEKLSAGVSASTNGALTIKNYYGGELGKGPVEQYVRVVQGGADFSWGLQGYTSSQFRKTMIVELPGAIKDGGHGYDMLWNAYNDHLASEYPGTKPVGLWTSEPNIIIMKEKTINAPGDLAGLKIRVAGAVAADVISALGATPVQMPIPQVYNALQTGLIDGIVTGASAVADFKLHEVANSYTIGAPLGRISFFAVMNQAKYDGLPDDQKKAIDDNSGRGLSMSAENAWNAKADKTIADLQANSGKTVVTLSGDGVKAFADITLPLAQKVLASIDGGDAILKSMRGE